MKEIMSYLIFFAITNSIFLILSMIVILGIIKPFIQIEPEEMFKNMKLAIFNTTVYWSISDEQLAKVLRTEMLVKSTRFITIKI